MQRKCLNLQRFCVALRLHIEPLLLDNPTKNDPENVKKI